MSAGDSAQSNSRWTIAGFEHYMLADETQAHPMVFWLKASFLGPTSTSHLTTALAAAVKRHPLLQATLVGSIFGRAKNLYWDHRHLAPPYLDCDVLGAALRVPHSATLGFDLAHEPGLRVFVRHDAQHSLWFLEFHHAVTDATGGMRFFEDLLNYYDAAAADPPESPRPVDLQTIRPDLLTRRGSFYLSRQAVRRRRYFDLWTTFKYYRFRPQPIVSRHPSQGSNLPAVPTHRSICHEFSAPALAALIKVARSFGGTLNDLLLRDFFLTLDAPQQRHLTKRRIRLCMPMNMRLANDELQSAANIMGMSAMDRTGPMLDDAHSLMLGIVAETKVAKQRRTGLALCFIPDLMGRLPLLLNIAMRRPLYWKCVATAILSNLGTSFQARRCRRNAVDQVQVGALTLERLELLPPCRKHTNIAAGVVTYGGRMTITFNYDTQALSDADAKSLLAAYVQNLSRSIASMEPESSDRSDSSEEAMRYTLAQLALRAKESALCRSSQQNILPL